MDFDVTIAVATYGTPDWVNLAHKCAIPSAEAQGVPVVHRHGRTLANARTEALGLVQSEWVIYLDADDELAEGYVAEMAKGTADVRVPVACYVQGERERFWQPRVFGHEHDCEAGCLVDGNWCLIGSAVRTELSERAGWTDYEWSEDWAHWIRCWKLGASFELLPRAIYRAHVRMDSRNRGATRAAKQAAHETIHRAEFPELYAPAAA